VIQAALSRHRWLPVSHRSVFHVRDQSFPLQNYSLSAFGQIQFPRWYELVICGHENAQTYMTGDDAHDHANARTAPAGEKNRVTDVQRHNW